MATELLVRVAMVMTRAPSCVIVRYMDSTFLTRLLPEDLTTSHPHERRRAALNADPALAGRVSCDDRGTITLTGPGGGLPPGSVKERKRWEMHVRMRLAAELGEETAAAAVICWTDSPERMAESQPRAGGESYAAP
jgi:hypothetical protein